MHNRGITMKKKQNNLTAPPTIPDTTRQYYVITRNKVLRGKLSYRDFINTTCTTAMKIITTPPDDGELDLVETANLHDSRFHTRSRQPVPRGPNEIINLQDCDIIVVFEITTDNPVKLRESIEKSSYQNSNLKWQNYCQTIEPKYAIPCRADCSFISKNMEEWKIENRKNAAKQFKNSLLTVFRKEPYPLLYIKSTSSPKKGIKNMRRPYICLHISKNGLEAWYFQVLRTEPKQLTLEFLHSSNSSRQENDNSILAKLETYNFGKSSEVVAAINILQTAECIKIVQEVTRIDIKTEPAIQKMIKAIQELDPANNTIPIMLDGANIAITIIDIATTFLRVIEKALKSSKEEVYLRAKRLFDYVKYEYFFYYEAPSARTVYKNVLRLAHKNILDLKITKWKKRRDMILQQQRQQFELWKKEMITHANTNDFKKKTEEIELTLYRLVWNTATYDDFVTFRNKFNKVADTLPWNPRLIAKLGGKHLYRLILNLTAEAKHNLLNTCQPAESILYSLIEFVTHGGTIPIREAYIITSILNKNKLAADRGGKLWLYFSEQNYSFAGARLLLTYAHTEDLDPTRVMKALATLIRKFGNTHREIQLIYDLCKSSEHYGKAESKKIKETLLRVEYMVAINKNPIAAVTNEGSSSGLFAEGNSQKPPSNPDKTNTPPRLEI